MNDDDATVLVVDDLPQNVRLMDAVLSPLGFTVVSAMSGEEALDLLARELPDIVLLDIMMPGMDGYEVCRRIRNDPATAFLPVVVITASGSQQKVRAIEAGADDFVTKPFNRDELLARIASLARLKRYHDTIERQAAELAKWNSELSARVEAQVAELQRANRLRRFLAPQLAELVIDSGDESFLESHRREIVVVFCDLRNFTGFAESSEPEEVTGVLNEYHAALGELIFHFEGTLERFTGDGLMVFFNDPLPCADAPERAVAMAVAMRGRVDRLADGWRRRGHDLGFGVGVAQGFATLGRIGFPGRSDYAAIGSVTNLAALLCGAAARDQILVTQRVFSAVEDHAVGEPVGELDLRGFSRPVRAFNITAIDAAEGPSASVGIGRRRAEEERVDNASPSVSDDEVGGYERDARADT
jgi:adenylate cyclase